MPEGKQGEEGEKPQANCQPLTKPLSPTSSDSVLGTVALDLAAGRTERQTGATSEDLECQAEDFGLSSGELQEPLRRN